MAGVFKSRIDSPMIGRKWSLQYFYLEISMVIQGNNGINFSEAGSYFCFNVRVHVYVWDTHAGMLKPK